MFATAVTPFPVAKILVDANFPGDSRTSRKVWKDNGDMSDLGHDWIRLIQCALSKSHGMHVYISDDLSPHASTMGPKLAESSPVNLDNPGVERLGVDVIVVNELLDAPRLPLKP